MIEYFPLVEFFAVIALPWIALGVIALLRWRHVRRSKLPSVVEAPGDGSGPMFEVRHRLPQARLVMVLRRVDRDEPADIKPALDRDRKWN